MKTITIRDRDGRTLHEGQAHSLKRLVEDLVAEGKSMARADLRDRDLSGLDLSKGDFDEALLDGADLRACTATGASFVGASMRGVQAQGLIGDRALFQGADLGPDPRVRKPYGAHETVEGGAVPSHFEGARLTFSNFAGARLDRVRFDEANMARSSLARAEAKEASFRAVTLGDTDFSCGSFVRCDFSHSRMRATTRLPVAQLPDRTRGTTAVGCAYGHAETDVTVGAFRRDRFWTGALKVLATTASSAAIVLAVQHLGLEGEALAKWMEEGTTLVVATTAAVVLKERASEFLRDLVSDKVADLDGRLRRFVADGVKVGQNLAHVGMAIVSGPGRRAVLDAIAATRTNRERAPHAASEAESFEAGGKAYGSAQTTILFADRTHLARALEIVSSGKTRHRTNGDVVLVRADATDPGLPSVIRYRNDGGTSLAWTRAGRLVRCADYDRAGDLLTSTDPSVDRRINGYMRGFGKSLLARHGVSLKYREETHELRAGRDGSILVVNRQSKRPDNRLDAAIVGPTGHKRYFVEGTEDIPDERIPHDETAGLSPAF